MRIVGLHTPHVHIKSEIAQIATMGNYLIFKSSPVTYSERKHPAEYQEGRKMHQLAVLLTMRDLLMGRTVTTAHFVCKSLLFDSVHLR